MLLLLTGHEEMVRGWWVTDGEWMDLHQSPLEFMLGQELDRKSDRGSNKWETHQPEAPD